MFRNAAAPMQGNKSGWAVGGSCFTAQVVPFHPEWFADATVVKAIWRVTWLPNITNGAQTAVRLSWVDTATAGSATPGISVLAATFSGGKPNSPLNEAFDITTKLNAVIASHANPQKFFQIFTEETGDGTYGPLIYSSALEIVFNV